MTMKSFYFAEEKKVDDDDLLEFQLSVSSALDRVKMTLDHFGSESVTLLTSFGVQSGVMLALVAEACPGVRVLFIDTQGPTSQRDLEYGRQLLDHLGLKNFTVAKADVTREEFRQGMEEVGIKSDDINLGVKNAFHRLSQDVFKVAPLKQECSASNVQCLLSGVRRGQTRDRDHFKFLQYSNQGDPAKAHPILDWSDEDCLEYLSIKDIPPHPELSSLVREIDESKTNEEAKMDVSLSSSLLRSRRPSRGSGMECGIHVQSEAKSPSKVPIPSMPNVVVGKSKCRFCVAAKKLLTDLDIDYVEAPVHLFSHLIPAGTKTVPVVYLNKQLIGGYDNLCEHLEVEDSLNADKQ